MHDNRQILLDRVRRTLDQRVYPAVTTTVTDLAVTRYDIGEPKPLAEVWDADFRPAAIGDAWGPAWDTTWFRFTAEVPEAVRDRHLELVIDLGWADHSPGFQAEGLVYGPDRAIIKALNPRNPWVPVARGAARVEVTVEAAANPLILGVPPFVPTPLGDRTTAPRDPLYHLTRAALVEVHDDARRLAWDLDALLGLAQVTPETDQRSWEVLIGCGEALDALDLSDIPGSAGAARERLRPLLAVPARPGAHVLSATGHAHIDSAWLWPIRETRRKAARTLANVVRLLDDGSTMVFALPAAQHVAWIEQDHPDLFAKVRHYVETGAIVPVGAMWVEPDAVLPGAEAMARQLVEGTRYFREKLGSECREIWLPDSFGYSGALPQLAHLAGVDRFLTQKISWNQVDVFPHHTLWWEGIDGTRIFTHFPPVDTYGAEVSAQQLHHAETNFKDKGRAHTSMLPYGYGDGGGGPTREMLERIDRYANLDGLPRVVHESPRDFFDRAQAEYPDAPVWVGELYLELHRGTFTSQRVAKVGNRRSEALLREAELWAATAAWRTGYTYPAAALREAWQAVLLCQFHDILPGTSIAWVYREVADLYAHVREVAEGIIADAVDALTEAEDGSAVVGNAGSFPSPLGPDAAAAPLSLAAVPAVGQCPRLVSDGTTLSNGVLTARVSDGYITSLVGLDGREVVPPGQRLGEFHLHQDFPDQWDAWDVDIFYRGSREVLAAPTVERAWTDADGAHLRTRTGIGETALTTTWTLAPGSPALDVRLDVDWHERERLLKFALPLDVHTDHAQYETQFGHITRSTTENTSWDAYRFEVSAHRWLRVAEGGWGVAVANESTYGWDVTRHPRAGGGTYSLVRASVVRGPRYPDPETDQGSHTFAYSIRPGASVPDAVAEAHRLNLPLRRFAGRALAAGAGGPVVAVDGAVVESVSLDEATGDLLVRLYEATGARSQVTLAAPEAARARGVDLLYRDTDRAVALAAGESAGEWRFELGPFQIATVRLSR